MTLTKLSDIFEVSYGVSLELSNLETVNSEDGIPFISRRSGNNGVAAYVSEIKGVEPNEPHTLSVAGGGSVLETFYQAKPYYSSFHLFVLKPLCDLSVPEMLAYATIIRLNRYRYNYGRQANRTLACIDIPTVEYVRSRICDLSSPVKPSSKSVSKDNLSLSSRNWKGFIVSDLFEVRGTTSHTAMQIEEYGEGKFPYIVTSSENNGLKGYFDRYTEDGQVLTVDSATVGSCFYQAKNFSASDHVEKLVPKFSMDVYIALFFTTILGLEKFRYGYGRKFSQLRLNNTEINLPVDENGLPDWKFIREYMKSLPYSSNLNKLASK